MSVPPVRATFLCFGGFWGTWAVSAFDVQRFLRLSDGGLGLLLALTVLGGAVANAGGGVLAERHGARRTLTVALTAWATLLLLAAACPWRLPFMAAFVLTVAAGGLVDIVMNVAGTAALGGSPRQMLRLHALFNAGTVVGAAVTGVVVAVDGSWRVVWGAFGVVAFALATWVRRAHIPAGERGEHLSLRQGLAALRRSGLRTVAVVFALGALVEGGIGTWGVLYLRSRLALAALAGAAAYVVGQSLATVARLSLGGLADRLGERLGTRASLVVAGAGLALQAATDISSLAAIGLVIAGVGASVYWPLLLAYASRDSERRAVIVGGLGAAGYVGFLAGPPVVGWVADAFGLRAGLLVLACVGIVAGVVPLRGPVPRPLT